MKAFANCVQNVVIDSATYLLTISSPDKCIILYVLYVYTTINSHTVFQHCACRVRPHLSDLLYFLSLCTLTARAQMTLPHTTTMSRTAALRVPCTMFDVSSLAVAKAVYGAGVETSLSDDMHSLYALTIRQCCSIDGDRITSYSITNGNQCDVIAHSRGKVSDVIAAPRHICGLPLVTGRSPGNVDFEIH